MKFFAIAMQNYKKQGRLQQVICVILQGFIGLFTILILKAMFFVCSFWFAVAIHKALCKQGL
jgi:hypothetical protein